MLSGICATIWKQATVRSNTLAAGILWVSAYVRQMSFLVNQRWSQSCPLLWTCQPFMRSELASATSKTIARRVLISRRNFSNIWLRPLLTVELHVFSSWTLKKFEWRDGNIIQIQGKECWNCCNNHRPMTLLSVPDKVLAHVMLARLETLMAESRWPQQSDFTAGQGRDGWKPIVGCRCTADAFLALCCCLTFTGSLTSPTTWPMSTQIFSVNQWALWRAFWHRHRNDTTWSYSESLHQTNLQVRFCKHLSTRFQTQSGIWHGCV